MSSLLLWQRIDESARVTSIWKDIVLAHLVNPNATEQCIAHLPINVKGPCQSLPGTALVVQYAHRGAGSERNRAKSRIVRFVVGGERRRKGVRAAGAWVLDLCLTKSTITYSAWFPAKVMNGIFAMRWNVVPRHYSGIGRSWTLMVFCAPDGRYNGNGFSPPDSPR